MRIVTSQKGFDAAVKEGAEAVRIDGSPRIECWDSSQPRIECGASSQPRIVCWDSSRATVRAAALSVVVASGAVHIDAGDDVTVVAYGTQVSTSGGQVLRPKHAKTAEHWCRQHRVAVEEGVATLYKAVDDEFQSRKGGTYTPGTTPVADDWDGGERECGDGLHFSPSPASALRFFGEATRFVACPVSLDDIPKVHPDGYFPEKVKARGCCAPVYEVDIDGNPVNAATANGQ